MVFFTKEIPSAHSLSPMASQKIIRSLATLLVLIVIAVSSTGQKASNRRFWIDDDMFWKDDSPFQIIGGDVHYFRVHPQYWEDRLLRAKALGLNTIQTYVPWNIHEPQPERWVFEGFADIESFVKLADKLGLLVMLRAGPYICAEWDLGGFPAWLLAIEPALRLRSSDVSFLGLVERWWEILLPKLVPLLYENGGPIIMVQVENEFGSYGNDKAYLHHLVTLARQHLGNDTILYTTDGGTKETLEKGTVSGDNVYSAVDFSTGEDPWPIFELQKKYNAPGKSPPLSAEFYTGWLTHWGESNAKTDAKFTAAALEMILSRNGSVVLYMAHGGTNFGFFNGANTGQNVSDYKPDLTSYDYDAPIKESGDVDNKKFRALKSVIQKHCRVAIPPPPPNNEKERYGSVVLKKAASLFDFVNVASDLKNVASDMPLAMELIDQMFGFVLYVSEFPSKEASSTLFIEKVHDRAQVFVSCSGDTTKGNLRYIGVIERWSNKALIIPQLHCSLNITLYVLVENLGRINYGKYIYDRKGILSAVTLDGIILRSWKSYPIAMDRLSNLSEGDLIEQVFNSRTLQIPEESISGDYSRSIFSGENVSEQPGIYRGSFYIHQNDKVKDTFLSFQGWTKGIAFVNSFNVGRYWPLAGPQCTLYVPAPILQHGENVLVLLELHEPSPDLRINLVEKPNFTCGKSYRG